MSSGRKYSSAFCLKRRKWIAENFVHNAERFLVLFSEYKFGEGANI